ncbi:MAG TPA: CNNM domain-containing protein, partial [Anaeromyxobacteraceae bacterium]
MGEGFDLGTAAATALALVLVRALVAGFEAALVAVGLPRAEELAAEGGASRRALALAALLGERERPAALVRVLDTLCALGAGAAATVLGARALPTAPAL